MKDFFNIIVNKIKSSPKIQKIIYLYLFLYIVIISLAVIKVDKEIITPGVINDPSYFISVSSDDFETYDGGNVNTIGVYVTYKPSILQYIFSITNNKIEISDYNPESSLSPDEQILRSTHLKDLSITNSLITAYKEAQKKDLNILMDFSIKGILITAVLPNAYSRDLQIGDIITAVIINGVETKISSLSSDYLDSFIEIIRNNKTFTLEIERNEAKHVVDFGWNKDGFLGLELNEQYQITRAYPEYHIDNNTVHNSIGSSGGMMLALKIYNTLLPEDITHGLVICGTGTVDVNGNIGAIGGIKQKIYTSQLYKSNIFFSPFDEDELSINYQNYSDALSAYQSINKPTFKLVKVKCLTDIISYLEGIGEDDV